MSFRGTIHCIKKLIFEQVADNICALCGNLRNFQATFFRAQLLGTRVSGAAEAAKAE